MTSSKVFSRFRFRAALIFLLLFGGINAGAKAMAAPTPQAILTDVRGGVVVLRGGKSVAAKNGAPLQSGDVVRVARGAATVYYVTRAPQKLRDGQQVRVGAAGKAGAPSMWRNVVALLSNGFERRKLQTPGVVRPEKTDETAPPLLIEPANTLLETTRPRFVWHDAAALPDANIADYRLVILAADGREMWSGLSKSRALQLPPDAPPLIAGREYSWRIEPRENNGNAAPQIAIERISDTAKFRVATLTETKAAQNEIIALRAATKNLAPAQRVLVEAGAWAQRGFSSRALRVLAPQLASSAGAEDALQTLANAAPQGDATRTAIRQLLGDNTSLLRRFDAVAPKNDEILLATGNFERAENARKAAPADLSQRIEATDNAAAAASALAWASVDAENPEAAKWFARARDLKAQSRALSAQQEKIELAQMDAEIEKLQAAREAAPPAQQPLLSMEETNARITRGLRSGLGRQAQLFYLGEELSEESSGNARASTRDTAPNVARAAFEEAASTRDKTQIGTREYVEATRAVSAAASRVAWFFFDNGDAAQAGEWFDRAAKSRREAAQGLLAWQENELRDDEAQGAQAAQQWTNYGADFDESLRAKIADWKRVLAAQEGVARQNLAMQMSQENNAQFKAAAPENRNEILRQGMALNALIGLVTRLDLEKLVRAARLDLLLRTATENNDGAARLRYAERALQAARGLPGRETGAESSRTERRVLAPDAAQENEAAPLSDATRRGIVSVLFDVAAAQSNLARYEAVQVTLQEARAQILLLPQNDQPSHLATLENALGSLEDKRGEEKLARAHFDEALSLLDRDDENRQNMLNEQAQIVARTLKTLDAKDLASTRALLESRLGQLRLITQVSTASTRVGILISAALAAGSMDDTRAQQSYVGRAHELLAPLEKNADLSGWMRGIVRDLRGLVQQVEAKSFYAAGDVDGALKLMRRVVAQRRARGRDEYTALALRDAGQLLDESGETKRARDYLTQAQRIFAAVGNTQGFASTTLFLGRIAQAQGDLKAAENAATLMLAASRSDRNGAFISAGARLLAAVRLDQKNADAASLLIDEAQAANAGADSPLDRAALLDLRARVLESRGQNDEALARYKEAVALIETVRAASLSPSGFSNLRTVYKTYERLVSLLIRTNRADEAFDYLGRARSKKLQDEMRLSAIKSDDPRLKSLLQRAAALENRLRDVETQLADERARPDEKANPARLENLTRVAASTRGEFSRVALEIRAANPNFDQILTVSPTLLRTAQKRLPEDAVLVEYAPLGEKIYVFVVTRENLKIVELAASREALWQRIRDFRRQMESASRRVENGENAAGNAADQAALETNLTSLYAMLLEPLQDDIAPKRVVAFVPSGLLYYLPMHALAHRVASTRGDEKTQLRFFIEEKAVAYLVQADVLALVLQPAEAGSARGMTAIGNPLGADLPESLAEVQGIARVYPATSVLSGAAATLGAVKEEKNLSRRVLHFATHGVLNATSPLQSYIQLAKSPPTATPQTETRLTLGEVAGLDLGNVDLVTLSACRTALGERDPEGREITSLAQAFSTAGAKSIIASLWSVADESTKDMMVDFYTRLSAGEDKAGALQNAMLRVQRDPRYAHPFYWAPFDLMGDWR